MVRRPPRSTRTDTRFPYTTLFRSSQEMWRVMATPFVVPRQVSECFAQLAFTIEGAVQISDDSLNALVVVRFTPLQLGLKSAKRLSSSSRITLLSLFLCNLNHSRSEQRRVGKECVSGRRVGWWPD